MSSNPKPRYEPGLTLKGTLACILGLLISAILTQYWDVVLGVPFASEHTIALPAVWAMLAIGLVGVLGRICFRTKIFTRSELLCAAFVMMMAVPLMTQGFWHRIISVIATNPRMADFAKLDVTNDALWPHGRNLVKGVWLVDDADAAAKLSTSGTVSWAETDVEEGATARCPVLENTQDGEISSVRLRLPVCDRPTDGQVLPGEPYLVSVKARATRLGGHSSYYCRAWSDDEAYTEIFTTSQGCSTTCVNRTGFVRVGTYGAKFETADRGFIELEFGLSGPGRLELHDPVLMSVNTLETIYRGRRIVTRAEYDAAPVESRAGLIVRPDSLWSPKGVAFLLGGYIPWKDWATPMTVWTVLIVLILAAAFAVNVIMRRQWMDNERFQLPVARIPVALIDDRPEEGSIWKNRLMWIGFAAVLAWDLLKAWAAVNPKVPNLAISVRFDEYFTDPAMQAFFSRVRFQVDGIFLAMCLFMELNVLLSLVVGYFAFYRSQAWIGEVAGWSSNPSYPWADYQAMGAFLGYGLVVIFFARKYLWRVIKAAWKGDRKASEGESLSYRGALLLFLFSFAGAMAWARWMGMQMGSVAIFFGLMALCSLVSSRIRTECGTPWGYFTPGNMTPLLLLLGGISVFGAQSMLFFFTISFLVAPTVFFLIPGAQMELLEYGRRWRVRPSHLWMAALLGAVGGMVVGGWVFLSNAYALGGETLRYAWAFDSKWWYFFPYNQDMNAATLDMLGTGAPKPEGLDPAWIAFGAAGLVSIVLATLRQLFAGFSFHPVGYVLSYSGFISYIWGSALVAWVVRALVLWMGGAAAVRNKLRPIAVGIFLGEAVAYLLLGFHTIYMKSIGVDTVYGILTPP
ncbi:MAG: DUF6785 family protein [Kiritimatiellia bacterium]